MANENFSFRRWSWAHFEEKGGGGEEKSSKINIAKKHDRVVIISCKILIVNTRSNAKIYDVQRADDVGNIAADLLSFPVLRSVFRQRPLEMKTWR